jgi:hypothetical protein
MLMSTMNSSPTVTTKVPGAVPSEAWPPGVGVAVGVPGVGVDVAVGQGPGHGSTVMLPSSDAKGINAPEAFVKMGELNATSLVPGWMATNSKLARTPVPLAPAGVDPRVAQASTTYPGSDEKAGHSTVRPVLPRKVPLTAEAKERIEGSYVRLTSYAPRFRTFSRITSNETDDEWTTLCEVGSTRIRVASTGVFVPVGAGVDV